MELENVLQDISNTYIANNSNNNEYIGIIKIENLI